MPVWLRMQAGPGARYQGDQLSKLHMTMLVRITVSVHREHRLRLRAFPGDVVDRAPTGIEPVILAPRYRVRPDGSGHQIFRPSLRQ